MYCIQNGYKWCVIDTLSKFSKKTIEDIVNYVIVEDLDNFKFLLNILNIEMIVSIFRSLDMTKQFYVINSLRSELETPIGQILVNIVILHYPDEYKELKNGGIIPSSPTRPLPPLPLTFLPPVPSAPPTLPPPPPASSIPSCLAKIADQDSVKRPRTNESSPKLVRFKRIRKSSFCDSIKFDIPCILGGPSIHGGSCPLIHQMPKTPPIKFRTEYCNNEGGNGLCPAGKLCDFKHRSGIYF